jgi:hypothetical protein
MPVAQAVSSASLALSGSTLRSSQHRFGSMVQSFGPICAACFSGVKQRFHALDADAVFLLDLVNQFVRFGEQKIGVQGKHADVRAHARRDVDERDVLRAEAGRDGSVRMKTPRGPSAGLPPRSSSPRRPAPRRFSPVLPRSSFPRHNFYFPHSPKISSRNKNARELLAPRAASKSWKDFFTALAYPWLPRGSAPPKCTWACAS